MEDTLYILRRAEPDTFLETIGEEMQSGTGISFEQLLEQNEEVRGWITIPGTPVNYPILQGADNVKYVNADVYGRYCVSGSIFLDCGCAPDFSDGYSLLYGHHMEGGRMFGCLEDFLEERYLREHEEAMLYTPGEACRLHIFAAMNADGYDERWFAPDEYPGEGDERLSRLRALLKEAGARSEEAGRAGEAFADILKDKRLVVLSTCAREGAARRILVFTYISPEERRSGEEES